MSLTQNLIKQSLEFDLVKKTDAWNLESVVELSLKIAVLVKKNVFLNKKEYIELLTKVVEGVLDEMKKKEISLLDQGISMSSIEIKWDMLKNTVKVVLPVVFSRLPHFDLVSLFSCCKVSSVVETPSVAVVETPVVAAVAVVETPVVAVAVVVETSVAVAVETPVVVAPAPVVEAPSAEVFQKKRRIV